VAYKEATETLDRAIGMTVGAWRFINQTDGMDDECNDCPWPGEGVQLCLTDGEKVIVLTISEKSQTGEITYKAEEMK
jgi:hypothetical protein